MARIFALTVWQPWASLIAIGAKPFEFRGHHMPNRVKGEVVGIHAGARPARRNEIADLLERLRDPDRSLDTALVRELAIPLLEKAHLSPGILPLSHMVCTVRMCDRCRDGIQAVRDLRGLPGVDSDRGQHANRAWPLTDIKPFEPPIPAKGAQGFWYWEMPNG